MIFSLLLLALACYLLFTGSVPVGRSWRSYGFSGLGNLWARLSGLAIFIGLFQAWFLDITYGSIIFFGLALLLLIVAMLKELSGTVR